MPTRLERWMRSKDSAITARTPSSAGALGRPVARRARAVLLAREHDQRRPLLGVPHRRVVDRHRLALGQVQRDAALVVPREQVAQPDVGERAAHHHLVVAAARAVGVEVLLLHAVLDEVPGAGRVLLDRARGRDVVGRHGVAEQGEHARALDVPALLGSRAGPRSTAACARRSTRRPRRSGRPRARRASSSARRPRTPRRRRLRNISELHRVLDHARPTSSEDGQMSLRKTSLPSVSWPSGSSSRSMSIVPASAYATTSGGEAR